MSNLCDKHWLMQRLCAERCKRQKDCFLLRAVIVCSQARMHACVTTLCKAHIGDLTKLTSHGDTSAQTQCQQKFTKLALQLPGSPHKCFLIHTALHLLHLHQESYHVTAPEPPCPQCHHCVSVLNTHAPSLPGFFSTATQCVDTRHSAS